MSRHLMIGFSIAVLSATGFATHAVAQGKTRAEVRQELIDAQNHGMRFVTDTSYPDVSPLFRPQAERMQTQPEQSGSGNQAAGSSDAGKRATAPALQDTMPCTGPVSYCSPYFGS
ncbi:DUF4148 domain-containing protein [Burkholderia sp. Bp8963]|uniref:DUF4148 domain-containing protein n=1 Tax=Burkholderia sp. Bp8963 TaxID=2184547 RepID=UPI000F591452|nr:DUF4148 domain-containing protein [Burkholderia sp. Bp8963]RQS65991.1 DUF4148 domain-containing protein [Burkholderia sp. Bp8963]